MNSGRGGQGTVARFGTVGEALAKENASKETGLGEGVAWSDSSGESTHPNGAFTSYRRERQSEIAGVVCSVWRSRVSLSPGVWRAWCGAVAAPAKIQPEGEWPINTALGKELVTNKGARRDRFGTGAGKGDSADGQEPLDHDGRSRVRSRRSARILVVDDEAHVRSMVGATLEHQGYSVQLAESGREATEILKRGRFDLVLTDIVMQDGNGLALLERIRNDHPGMPVVMVSCHS